MIEIRQHTEAESNRDGSPWDCMDCGTRLVEDPDASKSGLLYVRCPNCGNGIGLDTGKVHRVQCFRVVVQI